MKTMTHASPARASQAQMGHTINASSLGIPPTGKKSAFGTGTGNDEINSGINVNFGTGLAITAVSAGGLAS